jgi:Ion channel
VEPESNPVTRRAMLRQVARAPDSYALLLLLLLVDYVILSVGWTGAWALLVTTLFIGLTALLTFHTSRVGGLVFKWVVVSVGLAMVASIVAAVTSQDQAKGAAFIIMALLRVTLETLLGAICVYVLIGLLFAYIDIAYQFIGGTSYFAQPGDHGPSDFVYFSFITMTTVGYGDLSPAEGLPRTTAVFEALAGQVFLVVLVARLVAMYTPASAAARRARLRARLGGTPSATDDDEPDPDDPGTEAEQE